MHRLVVLVLLTLSPNPPAPVAPVAISPSSHPAPVQPAKTFEQLFTAELERRRRRVEPPADSPWNRETLRAALIDPEPLSDPVLDLLHAAITAHAVALDGLAADLGVTDASALPSLQRLDPARGGSGSVRVVGVGPVRELVAHHRAWLEAPDGKHPATVVIFSLAGEEEHTLGRLVLPITRWIEGPAATRDDATGNAVLGGADGGRRVLVPEHWHARSELFWLEDGAWRRDEPVWLAARETDPPRRPGFSAGGLACDVDCSLGEADLTAPSVTTDTGLRTLPFRPAVEGIPSGARERARRRPRRQP